MGFLLNVLKTIFRPAVRRQFEELKKEMDSTPAEDEDPYKDMPAFKEQIEKYKKDCFSTDPEDVAHAKKMLKTLGVPIPEGATESKTSDEAIEELESAKKKLDLELITQEEYDRIKDELKQFIK